MTKPLHAGAAATGGVQAARLAALGWESHPQTLESPLGFCSAFLGGDPEVDFATGIGQRWSLLEPHGLAIKAYPSCGATHPAIDAALAVRAELDGESIENVRVGVSSQASRLLVYDHPLTGSEGRFSAQYTVAVALLRGRVGLDDFTDAALADREVATLMERVDVVVDDRHRDGTQYPASVLVRTATGRVLERTVELARGKNANPLTEAELKAKFVTCAGAGSGQLWQAIRHAELDRPLTDLMAATGEFGEAGGR
jgi:2-methylcitrate dehydratase PrpD